MCGIIGYVGNTNPLPILLDGLKRLEYRGYDSAGVALLADDSLFVYKKVGKVSELEKSISPFHLKTTAGIGHTRWATHGVPSDINAHPHTDCKKEIALIHNGIIENYLSIRKKTREHRTCLCLCDRHRSSGPPDRRNEKLQRRFVNRSAACSPSGGGNVRHRGSFCA